MNRALDDFERFHEEEREHASLARWDEPGEPESGCAHQFFAHPSHEPQEAGGDWVSAFHEALGKFLHRVEERRRKYLHLEDLSERVRDLESKLGGIETWNSFCVPITSFAPEPFEPIREIKVVVQSSDGESTASFFDANVNAAGCNQAEAFENLKDLILSRFQFLDAQPPEKLGPALAKQLAVLREFVRRRA